MAVPVGTGRTRRRAISHQTTLLVLASSESNDANYDSQSVEDPTNLLTPVGTFADSPSYYGTFDQNGDVYQLNETVINGQNRGERGGCWYTNSYSLASSRSDFINPSNNSDMIGFRVATVPEPSTLALFIAGAVGLLGYVWRRN